MTAGTGSATAEQAFAARITSDPARPFVTFYDDATGERAELSARSLGNWVAKTYFLLTDELGLGPGKVAEVRLPVHWLAAPILLGCWFAGLEVRSPRGAVSTESADAGALAAADVAFADEAEIRRWANGLSAMPDEVFAVSLLSMARSAEPPIGTRDYAASVRPHADTWQSVRSLGSAGDPALDGDSRSGLFARAAERARQIALSDGGRLMYADAGFSARDWITALVAPLAVGGTLVLVRNADPAVLQRRAASETVDIVIGDQA
jgi:uncharacterized protein (TIGR03089 family)